MSATPALVVDESAEDPHAELWFAEPPGFIPLPLDGLLPEPDSRAADALRTAAAPLLESAPDEQMRLQLIAHMASGQQVLAALRETGAVHCALGLHRDDVGGPYDRATTPLVSWFTISWRDTAAASRAATAARAVASAPGHDHVEYGELPCGPVTFSETMTAPPVDSGLPGPMLLQIRAHLPHPDCRRLALLTLSTTAVDRREEYRVILRRIVESVRFESPLRTAGAERVGTPP